MYVAGTGYIRHSFDFIGNAEFGQVSRIRHIGIKPNIVDTSACPIRFDKGSLLFVGIIVNVHNIRINIIKVYFFDSGLVKAIEFSGIQITVAIGILPDFHFAPCIIFSIKHTVAVAVQILQRLKSVSGFFSRRKNGVIAKQLRSIINLTVSVNVSYQQSVILTDPAALFGKAITIVVKICSPVYILGFYAVSV